MSRILYLHEVRRISATVEGAQVRLTKKAAASSEKLFLRRTLTFTTRALALRWLVRTGFMRASLKKCQEVLLNG